MADKLVTIATFWETWEAHLAKDRLLDAGINCFLSGENFIATYWLLVIVEGGIKLKVAESDATQAKKILENLKSPQAEEASDNNSDDQAENEVCPKCQSTDIEYERFSRKIFFLSILLLRFPLPFPANLYRCKSCGHVWR